MNTFASILYTIGWTMRTGGIIGGIVLAVIFILNGPVAALHYTSEDLTPYHEVTYEGLCPKFKDATTFEKWFKGPIRDLSWCEDYLHRL